MKKIFYFLLLQFLLNTPGAVMAQYLPWDELQNKFSKVAPNPKALSHVRCFLERHGRDTFSLKPPQNHEFLNRCYARRDIELGSDRVIALIDYTVDSDQERMFLIDRMTGAISQMAVAHGRYKSGFFRHSIGDQKNSIKKIKYFSNEIGSMASSTGFFIAGQDHVGKRWGRSLVIHGLENGINDNACERDVVIHGAFLMSKKRAYMLSSGCPMVSPDYIDHVVTLLRGESDEEMRLQTPGSLVFIYGPREAAWEKDSCPVNLRSAQ